MNARETAERHGGFVCQGNMQGVMADFASPDVLAEFQKYGKMPPRATTKAEVLSETQDGDRYVYEIKYSNDAGDSLTIRSKWGQQGEEWKIVEAAPV
jgi:hypothetical protein